MKKTLYYLFVALGFIFSAQVALAQSHIEVSDVKVPTSLDVDGTKLTLNGAGIRTKYFMDMYVGSLYVKSKGQDGPTIANADEEMTIHLDIISGLITSDKMVSATNDGFENSTGGNTAPLQKEIDMFMGAFSEEIVDGDAFQFDYTPDAGTKVYKNGTLKTTIAGHKFKKALFGIWLGNKPADKNLKKGMLGLD